MTSITSPRMTGFMKEARALFWPWFAVVTIIGMLPWLISPLSSDRFQISLLVASVGITLLVTLPLGNEFQHRTLSVLLAQPISRMEIWAQKFSVTIVAVMSAALVWFICWRGAFERDPVFWLIAGVFIITAIGSATFWTLTARSTVGGVILNQTVQGFVILIGVSLDLKQDRFALPA